MPILHTVPLTIDLSEPQQLRSISGVISQSRKRLRFAAAAVIVETLSELNSDERRAYWWSPQEVDCMISKASYSAEESRKNKVLVDAVDHALRDARRTALMANHSCHDNTIDTATTTTSPSSPLPHYDVNMTSNIDQGLKLWCQYGHSRRGLEKAVSRIHNTTRNNIVRKSRSTVLELARNNNNNNNNDEEIRSSYEKASRSSVLFAHMIALADAEAALYPFPATTAERRRSTTHIIKRNDSISSTTSLMTSVSLGSVGRSSPRQSPQQPYISAICLKEVSNHHYRHQQQQQQQQQ